MKIKELLQLLKWDTLLLHRNNLIVISVFVAAMYVGIFYLLKPLGNLSNILIILLFNDPVVTGFMFAGLIFMFDKNQNTLQAVQVVPLPLSYYLISKTIALALLATVVAFIMTFAAHGFYFNYLHLFFGMFASAVFFIFFGFIFASYSATFNHFLLYTVGFLVPMGLPVLVLFEIGNPYIFMILPSYASIRIMQAAFEPGAVPLWQLIYAYMYLSFCIAIGWKIMLQTLQKRITA